jgi:hypothetical protein
LLTQTFADRHVDDTRVQLLKFWFFHRLVFHKDWRPFDFLRHADTVSQQQSVYWAEL